MASGIGARLFARDAKTGVLWLIAVTALWRIVAAWAIGYGTGEAYYVATARGLELSYFDQPPLSLWITWTTMALTGTDNPVVLRLPFIALFAVSTWLVFRIGEKLHSPAAGLFSAVILNASILFWVSIGSWIQPDAPMVTFWLATTLVLVDIFFGDGGRTPYRSWLWAGLLLGLTLLSKYHGAFLLGGAGLYMLANRDARRWLRHPAPWLGVALALVIFVPVVVWNAQNDWASFGFQGGRALGESGLRWGGLLLMVVGQLLYMTPWLAIPALVLGVKALQAGPEGRYPAALQPGVAAFLAYSAWPAIVVFTLVALWSDTQFHFHWQAPGYLMLFILMGCWSAEMLIRRPRAVRVWLYGSLAVTALILTVLMVHAATGFLRGVVPGDWEDPTAVQLPWTEAGAVLAREGAFEADRTFVAGDNWIDCGYVDNQVSGRVPFLCLGAEPRNLGFIADPADYAGWNGYMVVTERDMEQALARNAGRFETVTPVEEVFVRRGGVAEIGPIQVLYGEGFLGE